jgi:hypothetical protein
MNRRSTGVSLAASHSHRISDTWHHDTIAMSVRTRTPTIATTAHLDVDGELREVANTKHVRDLHIASTSRLAGLVHALR